MIENKVNILINLLKDKLQLIDQYFELTQQQTKMINKEKVDKLNKLMDKKSLIFQKIEELDEKIDNNLNFIKNISSVNQIGELNIPKNLFLEYQNLKEELENKIIKTHQLERDNKSLMENKFAEVKAELRRVRTGKKTRAKYYQGATQTSGYFVDKKN